MKIADFQLFSRYNLWATQKLTAHLAQVSNEDFFKECFRIKFIYTHGLIQLIKINQKETLMRLLIILLGLITALWGFTQYLVQRQLDQFVLLQPVKQNAFIEYEKIKKLNIGLTSLPNDDIENGVRNLLRYYLRNKISGADDEGHRLWATSLVQQLHDAKAKGNCEAIAFYDEKPVNSEIIRSLLTPMTQQQAAQAITYIINHKRSNTSICPQGICAVEQPKEWEIIEKRMIDEFGPDVELFNHGLIEKEKNKQCVLKIRLFENILALPPQQSSTVLHWFFTKSTANKVAIF